MISRKATFAAGVITTLVLVGSGTAVAANGGNLVLGKNNKATKTTQIKNKKGAPLSLSTKAKHPPLKVNSSKRVNRLNADQLDGLSAEHFALASGNTAYVAATSYLYNTIGIFAGYISQPKCPAGSKVTGGGFSNTMSGEVFVDRPDGGSTWRVAALGELGYDDASDLVGYAVCYNPRGNVPAAAATLRGAMKPENLQRTVGVTATPEELAKLEKLARR